MPPANLTDVSVLNMLSVIIPTALIAILGIYMYLKNKRRAPVLPPTASITPSEEDGNTTLYVNGTQIPINQLTNFGRFDDAKFNAVFEEQKKRRKLLLREKENDELKKLNKDVLEYPPLMDMRVYDLVYEYESNVRGIITDVMNGEDWTKPNINRTMYFGWTLVIVSLLYFVLSKK
jgi:hypothetical protein